MFQFLLTAMRSGLRGRSFYAVFALGIALIGVAYLTGYFSPRQPKTVALDVGFSGLRFSLVLLSLFWIQELVGNEIERKTVIFALSYPVSRAAYLLGRFFGILGLTALAALVMGLLLWLAVLAAGSFYEQEFSVNLGFPYWWTIIGIWLDVAVVIAFAFWVASLSTVPVLPLVTGMAFAIGGRGLGAVQDYLLRGADGDQEMVGNFGPAISLIRWVLPDLSRLDWRVWPMYSAAPDWQAQALAVVMAAAYSTLMLLLAIRAFSRREMF